MQEFVTVRGVVKEGVIHVSEPLGLQDNTNVVILIKKDKMQKALVPSKKGTNELFSALSHLVGTVLAVAGLTLLVVYAGLQRTPVHVVSFALYGAMMSLLYLMSTLYHFFPKGTTVKRVFRRFDHIMIFQFIAGTYTPICLIALKGTLGWVLFGIIWALAVLGTIFKAVFTLSSPGRNRISTIIYVLMGWACVIAIIPIFRNIGIVAFCWLLGGGTIYTVGAVIYAWSKKQGDVKLEERMHGVFHVFVLVASICHFVLMMFFLLPL